MLIVKRSSCLFFLSIKLRHDKLQCCLRLIIWLYQFLVACLFPLTGSDQAHSDYIPISRAVSREPVGEQSQPQSVLLETSWGNSFDQRRGNL